MFAALMVDLRSTVIVASHESQYLLKINMQTNMISYIWNLFTVGISAKITIFNIA